MSVIDEQFTGVKDPVLRTSFRSLMNKIISICNLADANLNAINGLSWDYSETEQLTGKKWIDGKIIYSKYVDFGALPNSTTKSVAHGIVTISSFTHVEGFFHATSLADLGKGVRPLPYVSTAKSTDIQLNNDQANINITTAADYSGWSAYVILEYTKA